MQVKFRGKRKEGDEWLIGDLNQIDGEVFILPRQEDAPFNSPDWYEVEPSSIGMFTGLTDKNGKEIYGAVGENGGDIVYIAGEGVVQICFPFFELYEKVFMGGNDDIGAIIGNAFDNPELLEN